MCVAGLNVSLQPCAHRWYLLHHPCATTANLSNCTAKLRLEGWETRTPTCPWCENPSVLPDSTHRLFTSNPTPSPPDATRTRSSSDGTLDSLSRVSSFSSTASASSQFVRKGDRGMNERLDIYLTSLPHEVLPSARKNYPTYSNCSSGSSTAAEDAGTTTPTTMTMTEFPLTRRTSSGLGRKWRRSVQLSRDLFRG